MRGAPVSGLMTFTVTCSICGQEFHESRLVRHGNDLPFYTAGCRHVEGLGTVCPNHTITISFLIDGKIVVQQP